MEKKLFFMAALAGFLLVSCQSLELEQDAMDSPTRITLPYSLQVSTQATKVSFDENQYSFKDGDQLRITCADRADIMGSLAYDGTRWTGDLSWEEPEPDPETVLQAMLIHADNQEAATYAHGVADNLKDAIERYSLFTGSFTYGAGSVTLSQDAAFLETTVTFTFEGGIGNMPVGRTSVDVSASGNTTASGHADLVKKEGVFQSSFVAVLPGDVTLEKGKSKVSVCDRDILFIPADSDKADKALAANMKYTVERSVVFKPELGDPFWSDGTYGRIQHDPGVSVIGIIVYLNRGDNTDAALTEKSGDKYGHALVMSLKNVATTGTRWGVTGNLYTTPLAKPSETVGTANLSGFTNTNLILDNYVGDKSNTAAYRARNYSAGTLPSETTGWFLPSIGQWMYSIGTKGFGGANPPEEWIRNDGKGSNWLEKGQPSDLILVMKATAGKNALVESLNARLEVLKTEFGCEYDAFGMTSGTDFSDNYWTSSENVGKDKNGNDIDLAYRMNFGSVEQYNGEYYSSIKAHPVSKEETYHWKKAFIMKVRPFLAF